MDLRERDYGSIDIEKTAHPPERSINAIEEISWQLKGAMSIDIVYVPASFWAEDIMFFNSRLPPPASEMD